MLAIQNLKILLDENQSPTAIKQLIETSLLPSLDNLITVRRNSQQMTILSQIKQGELFKIVKASINFLAG